jgi:hypothetical protein
VDDASNFEPFPTLMSNASARDRVVRRRPGDVIAFYRTLHSAPGTADLMPTRRRAISFRWVAMPDCNQAVAALASVRPD